MRSVIVAGAVIMTAGAGAVTAEALTPAAGTAVHVSAAGSALPLTGEDDLGWQ
ncbi:hypothetical protein ACIRJO_41905 [Streptomyces sp. NPDC102394]|uniref:hypothetical protein n=1 Tax=Streptomyces sp. NPDC102394 TaxID=3366167 RepID=UPI0038225678